MSIDQLIDLLELRRHIDISAGHADYAGLNSIVTQFEQLESEIENFICGYLSNVKDDVYDNFYDNIETKYRILKECKNNVIS